MKNSVLEALGSHLRTIFGYDAKTMSVHKVLNSTLLLCCSENASTQRRKKI